MTPRPDIPVVVQRDLIRGLVRGLGVEDIARNEGYPVALLREAVARARKCGALEVLYRRVLS